VIDQAPSLVDPTLPLESEAKVVDPTPSSVNPTLPLESEPKLIDMSTSSVDLIHQVVDSISPSINPTPPLKSDDVAQVFIITADSSRQGSTSPIPLTPPSTNQMISIDWNPLK
jgi:hypothetical protein